MNFLGELGGPQHGRHLLQTNVIKISRAWKIV